MSYNISMSIKIICFYAMNIFELQKTGFSICGNYSI